MATPSRRGRVPASAAEPRSLGGFVDRGSAVPLRLVDMGLTAPEAIYEPRPMHAVPEQSLALFALRDSNERIIDEWRVPVLPESVIEQLAEMYLRSSLRRVMTFAAFAIARGF